MRSIDVLRSVKKYVSGWVLPEYEVRLASEEGAWERPFCRVGWSTGAQNIPQGKLQVETRRTMNLVVWPKESDSPDLARLAAEDLVEKMTQAFVIGLHTPSYRPSSNRAHPARVPVWRYAGVDVNEAVADDARDPRDFASIIEPAEIGDLEDPDTENSRLVVVDLRLRWMRAIGIPSTGEIAETVGAHQQNP